MSINLKSLQGTIIMARYPEGSLQRPGKYRPCVVIDADLEGRRLKLAYGTSRKTHQEGRGEMTIPGGTIPGLENDGKFCLGQTEWIPFSAEFLLKHPNQKQIQVFTIPRQWQRILYRRLEEIS